jgi:hypothetical protein
MSDTVTNINQTYVEGYFWQKGDGNQMQSTASVYDILRGKQ